MQISLKALVLATLALEGALAQPAHRHAHQHKRSFRDILVKRNTPSGGWNNPELYKNIDKEVNFSTVSITGLPSATPAPNPSPPTGNKMAVKPEDTPSSETPPQSTSEDDKDDEDDADDADDAGDKDNKGGNGGKDDKEASSGSCSNLADVFESGDTSSQGPTSATARKIKRATFEQDTYVGNTGGGEYGSNMKPEPNCKASGTHSLKFTNNMGSEETFWLWNKIGADGSMNGMMKNAYYQFKLANGQSAVFSVEKDTQTAFSQACGRAAGNGNVPNCNIGEANFDDQMSMGGSFYDVSMVTYNDIKNAGGSPNKVPMTISADGYDDSTAENCVYTHSSQNSPVQPGSSGKCACGPIDGRPFHVNVVYG